VKFTADDLSGFVTFPLQDVRLDDAGVDVRTVTWQWQYRRRRDRAWTDFALSEHRIYSVLELPKDPWQQDPAGPDLFPWTEALDYGCTWARGAHDRVAAAARVTKSVYDLGPSVLIYDCGTATEGGGFASYAALDFQLTCFLNRLRGEESLGPRVNCTDCATIVSTFANALGCELWQSVLGYNFDLNPMLAIGSNIWQPACGWPQFSYHEVGWEGMCGTGDAVFDACLQVDQSPPHHIPLLPANIRFGTPGSGEYRDLLSPDTPTGRPHCNPQPETRQHRSVT
jgi:hypothetical protein